MGKGIQRETRNGLAERMGTHKASRVYGAETTIRPRQPANGCRRFSRHHAAADYRASASCSCTATKRPTTYHLHGRRRRNDSRATGWRHNDCLADWRTQQRDHDCHANGLWNGDFAVRQQPDHALQPAADIHRQRKSRGLYDAAGAITFVGCLRQIVGVVSRRCPLGNRGAVVYAVGY